MVTIKSYSDLQQSKKLAEILPLESADMNYEPAAGFCTEPSEVRVGDIKYAHPRSIRCWSLAALLGVLEFPTLENDSIGKGKTGWMVTCYSDGMRYDTIFHDNPVDACYEMIIKLHELNLL